MLLCPVSGQVSISVVATDPATIAADLPKFQMAATNSIAYYAGVGTHTMHIEMESRNGIVMLTFNIFQVDAAMNLESISAQLFGTSTADFQVTLTEQLVALNFPVTAVSFSVLGISDRIFAGPA